MLTRGYSGVRAYCQSKLAQILFTIDLAEELKARNVTVNCLHPATYMDTTMVRLCGDTADQHGGRRRRRNSAACRVAGARRQKRALFQRPSRVARQRPGLRSGRPQAAARVKFRACWPRRSRGRVVRRPQSQPPRALCDELWNKVRFSVLGFVGVVREGHSMNKIAFVSLACLTLGACATPVQTVGTAGGVVAGAAIGGPVGAVVGGVTGAVVTSSRLCARRPSLSLPLPRPLRARSLSHVSRVERI